MPDEALCKSNRMTPRPAAPAAAEEVMIAYRQILARHQNVQVV